MADLNLRYVTPTQLDRDFDECDSEKWLTRTSNTHARRIPFITIKSFACRRIQHMSALRLRGVVDLTEEQ